MEIYLDNSATTKPNSAAISAAVEAMQIDYGNPSSLHKLGFNAEQMIEKAKQQLSAALFCDKGEIIFTSGATESNNLAITGISSANIRRGKRIVTTAIEHPSVMQTLCNLEKQGFEVVRLPLNEQNEYAPIDFYNAVNEDTILACFMQVNNETGLVLPVLEIAKAVKKKNPNTFVFVDAVQGFLKIPIKLKGSQIDLMSISGHKVHAPKGIGALYIKRGVRITPILYGGEQQGKIRPGTESTPLIAAFGAAVSAQTAAISENDMHYRELKRYFMEQLKDNDDIIVNSKENYAPHIISICVKGIRSEIMLHYLEQFCIYVSSGSACSKGKQSYVLSAMGYKKEVADCTLRISFCRDTTPQMLDELVKRLNSAISSLAKAI